MGKQRTLLIFPFNGNGIEALDCVGQAYKVLGFVDDTPDKQGISKDGYRIFGREAFAEYPDAEVLAVPGSPDSYSSRQIVIDGLGLNNNRFAKVIHPNARISNLSKMGHNVLIMAGVVITSNAVVGNHVCILPNTVLHHDVVVGDWSLIGSNITIAGHTIVGENCYIGSGSNIKNGISIGKKALVGLGSNVIRNVEQGTRVIGNPAKVLTDNFSKP